MDNLAQHLLHLGIVSRRIDVGVTIDIELIDIQRERLQVAHLLQHQSARLIRHDDHTVEGEIQFWTRQLLFLIAQIVHALPIAPLAKCLTGKGKALFAITSGHPVIAEDGDLASLRQITILTEQRIDELYLLVAKRMRSHDTSRTTVASLLVIAIKGVILTQLIANDAQEVATEDLAITALNHKGHILFLLDLCQLAAELVGQFRLIHLEA